MAVQDLGYEAVVPGNASRFFESAAEARSQPTGRISIAWREEEPYLFNSRFDSSIIRYDDSYCTTVVNLEHTAQLPTATYFEHEIMPHLPRSPRVIDIGCGQGEFVDFLSGKGLRVVGYDPALRRAAHNLHPRFWSPEEPPADLYVMRCVLPHIEHPWDFLQQVADSSPGALVLIEFQRIEWVLQHSIWFQLSHDHVNLFRSSDFFERYAVLAEGTFASNEWAWVLVNPSLPKREPRQLFDSKLASAIAGLSARRQSHLSALADLNVPLAIWGAAGKGIVLASALQHHHPNLFAIDADPKRWDKYLESSGVRVYPPRIALHELPRDVQILVSNPNHYREVAHFVNGERPVAMATDFGC